jgi:ribulose-phosphate 3-epimerase
MAKAKNTSTVAKDGILLAPSILSADFAKLAADAQQALQGGGSLLHVDVMDGHFVPNITLGPPLVKSLRKALPDVIFDCHLMIENPDDLIPAFAEAGANWISVHQEACVHLDRTLHLIESHGCKPGVVINPATPVHTLDEVLDIVHHVLVMSVNPGFGGQKFIHSCLRKMTQLAQIREKRGLNFRIEVDGGVALETVADVVRAGGEILVAGSAVFGPGDIAGRAKALLAAARAAKLTRT